MANDYTVIVCTVCGTAMSRRSDSILATRPIGYRAYVFTVIDNHNVALNDDSYARQHVSAY